MELLTVHLQPLSIGLSRRKYVSSACTVQEPIHMHEDFLVSAVHIC